MQPDKEKIDAFLKDYKELVDKHHIDFVNYPMFVPDGAGAFKVIVQNAPVSTDKQEPIPSPFIPQ